MERGVLVECGLVLGGVLTEGGVVVVHLSVGGDRVIGVALVEVVVERVGGVLPPALFGLSLDFGDTGINRVEFSSEGLHRAKDGSEGRVDRRRQFWSEGPFPSLIVHRRGRGSREGHTMRSSVCGGRGRGDDRGGFPVS